MSSSLENALEVVSQVEYKLNVGIGLIDYMVKSQIDHNDDYFPPFGVFNDIDNEYKKYKTDDTELDAMYIIKANAPINTTAHANMQSQINTGKVRFLIDANTAKAKLLGTVKGSKMTPEERQEYLRPYDLTSILRAEMLNLREENTGTNIILKQVNRGIPKDTFSSAEYALYYIRVEEEDRKRKKKFRIADAMFMT
nr:MAG TPA: terminase large subunit [Caudoviricetes sp.]